MSKSKKHRGGGLSPESARAAAVQLESEIFAAELDKSLPKKDFHGYPTAGIEVDVENFILENPDARAVRIIWGVGKGLVDRAVRQALDQLKKQKKIREYRVERNGISCVVLLPE